MIKVQFHDSRKPASFFFRLGIYDSLNRVYDTAVGNAVATLPCGVDKVYETFTEKELGNIATGNSSWAGRPIYIVVALLSKQIWIITSPTSRILLLTVLFTRVSVRATWAYSKCLTPAPRTRHSTAPLGDLLPLLVHHLSSTVSKPSKSSM